MTDISFSTVEGRYGITTDGDLDDPFQGRSAKDILILKRDGTYWVSLATIRISADGGTPSADLTGTYTVTGDGVLLLTSEDWGDSMLGYVQENGSIVLLSNAENSAAQTRWLARKIECIWPNCRLCRGHRWHYCVRAFG